MSKRKISVSNMLAQGDERVTLLQILAPLEYIYIYIYICLFFFGCLADICDGSPPATRRRGGYSETLAGGQPGPTRAAPPAALGVAARGGGSCGGSGSGGRSQR